MALQCLLRIAAEHYYSCDLTREIPVRVTIVVINGNTGFGIIEPLNGNIRDVQEYVNRLAAYDTVSEVEITHKSAAGYWTRVVHRLAGSSIYETVLESGCMTSLPIVVERGAQDHTVLCPSRAALSSLLRTLRSRFSMVEIRQLRPAPIWPSAVRLSEKQHAAVNLAYRMGYYELPRRTRVEDMCSRLGIRSVAMQERLRRAEQRLVRAYVERLA